MTVRHPSLIGTTSRMIASAPHAVVCRMHEPRSAVILHCWMPVDWASSRSRRSSGGCARAQALQRRGLSLFG